MAKTNKKKKKHRLAWTLIKIQLVLIGLVIAALLWYYLGGYGTKVASLHKQAVSLVASSTLDTFKQNETSIAYDVNGEKISVMKGEKDVYYVSFEDIPQYAKDAIISIEDKKFYSHHGVDYKAILRAVWAMVKNGKVTQGASTITQQLARNVFLTQDKTWERKVEEIYVAVELEKKYSKQQILEFYFNNVYFANGNYGIGAASKYYFNKDINELSLSEIAYLCAIPNRPTYYDPVISPAHTLTRRNKILKNMLEDKYISLTSYNQAVNEEISLSPPEEVKNNYAETFTFYCATRALMANDGFEFKTTFKNATEKTAYENDYNDAYSAWNQKLFTGGYRIYTSIDLSMQEKLQNTIDERLSFNTDTQDSGVYALQGAGVTIDNSNGKVTAIVGGRSQDLSGYTLNRAFQSFRQPGSSIKPLIVYTPALENGYRPSTIVYDTKEEDGPENADKSYAGAMPLRRAVELSKNTVAYKIFEEITPLKGISYLENMQFEKISDADAYPAAALGGFTNGVSPLDMAKGYATIENDGVYREPTCIIKITDSDGNTVCEPKTSNVVVYKENATRDMTDILTGVLIRGTGKGLGISETACAGKTGTTNDYKDGWFCGYTRYYTTSIWVGFDQPKKLKGLSGASYPGHIWHDYMEEIHEGKDNLDFLKSTEPDEEIDVSEENSEGENEDATENPDGTSVDGTVPSDGTVTNQNAATDGTVPTDGVVTEGTVPSDGTVNTGSDTTVNSGALAEQATDATGSTGDTDSSNTGTSSQSNIPKGDVVPITP